MSFTNYYFHVWNKLCSKRQWDRTDWKKEKEKKHPVLQEEQMIITMAGFWLFPSWIARKRPPSKHRSPSHSEEGKEILTSQHHLPEAGPSGTTVFHGRSADQVLPGFGWKTRNSLPCGISLCMKLYPGLLTEAWKVALLVIYSAQDGTCQANSPKFFVPLRI